jgi:hypothetical protein
MSLNNFTKIVVGAGSVMISAGSKTKLKDEQEFCA